MKYTPQFLTAVAGSGMVSQIDSGALTIDNSEYCTWDSCFAKGLYAGALKRVAARSRSPLAFGGAVHVGLDNFLKEFVTPKYLNSVARPAIDWRALALADAAVTELDSLGDPKRNTTKLLDILDSYTLEYARVPNMQFDILKIDGKPCVEQSFVVPLGTIEVTTRRWGTKTIEVMWSGKIDVLSLYEGAITPVDHKTTTVMGEKFVDDKVRSSQMLGYTYAARWLSQKLFGGMPVFGVRINALAMRSAGYEFKLFDIPYPDWKVAEWQQEALQSIKILVEELDLFLETGLVVPTREHCVTKYGKCQYFDVCDVPEKMRDRLIFDDSYFFVSDWSPLNE